MPDSSLEDRILIRELYGAYALAAARQDVDTWISCWAENGAWDTPHFKTAGRAKLRAQWDAMWTNFTNVAAFAEVGPIEVSGDRAKAHSCFLEIIRLPSGGVLKMAGLYEDELVRERGQWRFARRSYQTLSEEAT